MPQYEENLFEVPKVQAAVEIVVGMPQEYLVDCTVARGGRLQSISCTSVRLPPLWAGPSARLPLARRAAALRTSTAEKGPAALVEQLRGRALWAAAERQKLAHERQLMDDLAAEFNRPGQEVEEEEARTKLP